MAKFIHPDLIERHYSVALFRGYILLLKKKIGDKGVHDLFDKTGIPVEYFSNQTNYVSEKWVDSFYSEFIALPGYNIEDFDEAAKISMSQELMGYLQSLAVQFISVTSFMKASIQFAKKLNKVDSYKFHEVSSGRIKIEFTSRRETPHMDVILQGWKSHLELAPTLTGRRRGIAKIERVGSRDAFITAEWSESVIERDENYRFETVMYLLSIMSCVYLYTHEKNLSAVATSAIVFATSILYYRLKKFVKRSNDMNSHSAEMIEKVVENADQKHDELISEKKKVDRRYREARLLNTVIQRIGLAKSSQDLIDLTLSELKNSLGYDRVLYMAKTRGRLQVTGHIGFHGKLQKMIENYGIDLSVETSEIFHLGNVFKRKEHLLMPITGDYLDRLSADAAGLIKVSGSKSFLMCSVASISNSHGVLMVDYTTEGKLLSDDDLHLVKNLSNQLAIYLDQVVANEQELILRTQFQKFVPEKIVDLVKSDNFEQLGTKKRRVTVLFSDIRGFTKRSTEVSPEIVTKALNIYFSEMNKIIYGNGGLVDKFLGDGILAVFNAFDDCVNHEDAAVLSAVEMQVIMAEIGRKIKTDLGVSEEWAFWEIGIAVHSGEVIAGLVGTKEKMEFTVLGDAVNVAARLCELTKGVSKSIIISPAVNDRISVSYEIEQLEEITIRGHGGKMAPILVKPSSVGKAA